MVRSLFVALVVVASVFAVGMLAQSWSCATPAHALDASKLRRSVNVVDLRPELAHYTLQLWGPGDELNAELEIVCDDADKTCVVGDGQWEPSPVVTPTETAVFLPTVTKSPPVVSTPIPPTAEPTAAPSGLTRINHASIDELEALPHVGPVIRQRIVDARPLLSCSDADERVKGWGATMVAETCPLIDWTP